MKKIDIGRQHNLPASLIALIECLQNGGVIAAPTETVFGLMTLWQNERGRQRIFRMKERSRDKPLQMLAADLAMARRFGVQIDQRAEALATRCWPGPLTAVMPADTGENIGLRIPDHPFILELIRRVDAPLAATSANPSGTPPALTAAEVKKNLKEGPDLLTTGMDAEGDRASTVIMLKENGWEMLRDGPVSQEFIHRILADNFLPERH